MASEIFNQSQEDTTSTAPSQIQHLRALAQSNLTQIEAEDSEITVKEAAMARDLQKYAKVKRKDRAQHSPSPSPAPETKGARLRSAQDVLDRLRHDPTLKLSEYRVGYLERFEGIKETPASSWISESTDEDWIPQHRIRYVKRIDEQGREDIVWDREAKVDKIFGSGAGVSGGDDAVPVREQELESEHGGVSLSS